MRDLKKIKAIVSDFDGTLVGSEQKLSANAIKNIKMFLESGRFFSIASGKAYEGLLERACKELGLNGLIIVRGGSEIVSIKTGKVVWGKYIDSQTVSKILFQLKKFSDLIILAESGKDLFTADGKGNEEFATGALIKKLDELPLDKVPKIAVPPLFSNDVINPIYELLIQQYPMLHIVRTTSKKGIGFDINDGGAGKHIALLKYSELMNIDSREILGVGDSYNDYPLLSACGIKVAMGNAPKELKDIADFVVGTQENDGIVDVIRKIIY